MVPNSEKNKVIGVYRGPRTRLYSTCSTVTNDDNQPHKVSRDVANKLRIGAIVISIASLIVSMLLGVCTLVMSLRKESPASFGVALSALLDVMTSLVVLWRYSGGNSNNLYSPRKEQLACLMLGLLFLISSVSVISTATNALAHNKAPESDSLVWILSIVNGVILSIFTVIKMVIGNRLESQALVTDAFNSFAGAVTAFGIVISAFTYQKHRDIWYLDSSVGMVVAAFLAVYGIKLIWDQCNELELRCCQPEHLMETIDYDKYFIIPANLIEKENIEKMQSNQTENCSQ